MITDPIADLLTRIRNAQRAGHKLCHIKVSRMSERILLVLRREGFIDSFEIKQNETEKFPKYAVLLKYYGNGRPVIRIAKRVSRPGRRIYQQSKSLPRTEAGMGITLVSTSQGVMSDREARRKKLGGEVLAQIG